MNVEIIVRIGVREVAVVADQIQTTSGLELEEHVERLKNRAGVWGRTAETMLYEQGGVGLLTWLLQELKSHRGQKRQALISLINCLQPKLDRTDYSAYRTNGWQIGTGMIESTAKQLVGVRLKGPGMHWRLQGATAITLRRAQVINQNWHHFWKSFTIAT